MVWSWFTPLITPFAVYKFWGCCIKTRGGYNPSWGLDKFLDDDLTVKAMENCCMEQQMYNNDDDDDDDDDVVTSACELVLELINYDDKDEMLRGLVQLLQPSPDDVRRANMQRDQQGRRRFTLTRHTVL